MELISLIEKYGIYGLIGAVVWILIELLIVILKDELNIRFVLLAFIKLLGGLLTASFLSEWLISLLCKCESFWEYTVPFIIGLAWIQLVLIIVKKVRKRELLSGSQ